ncbi:MAG TPA: hypothetical protein VOB72_04760 [Candidatus Dormibacteraeota bacterium]|nr:hypothetical protein [Candidatus Dormibacteraeota bacterium]
MSRRGMGKQAAARRMRAVADWQCPRCLRRLPPGVSCGCWDEGAGNACAAQPAASPTRPAAVEESREAQT